MRAVRTLVLTLSMAGTLAGCVVYDEPYPYPAHRYYYYHHDRGDCWRCRWY